MMTAVLISLVVGGISIMTITRRYHRSDEMGYVSSRWLSEYRQNHES